MQDPGQNTVTNHSGLPVLITQPISFPSNQYYDDTYPSVKEQKAFEKNIFNKTHRTDSRSFSFHYSLCWRNHGGKGVVTGLQRRIK